MWSGSCFRFLFLLVVSIFVTNMLRANDFKISQTIKYSYAQSKQSAEIEWKINPSDGKFHMSITGEGFTNQYLFNGRNFYLCSKLAREQAEILSRDGFDPGISNKMVKGACQIAPTNFSAMFFLAPFAAILGIEQREGYALGFDLKNQDRKMIGKAKKVQGKPCQPRKVEFTAIDSADSKKSTHFLFHACQSSDLMWASKFYKELRKNILRQKSSRSLIKHFSKKIVDEGIPLNEGGELKRSSNTSIAKQVKYFVKATSIGRLKGEENYELPEGYEVIDQKTLEGLHSGSLVKTKKGKKESDAELSSAAIPAAILFLLGGLSGR